jgi:gamma-glutamyl-gamma-aminobutyrate hydrolase PuuD
LKLVAVSQRVDLVADRQEVRDSLDRRLVEFLRAADCLAIPVPNGFSGMGSEACGEEAFLEKWLETLNPAAIVLSGGNDIGKFPARDQTETFLLNHAQRLSLPVLGICRGMQMMAHTVGGRLDRVEDHIGTRHHLSGILEGSVNSYHAWSLVDCPDGYRVLARSDDGVIEAIGHLSMPWEGWMWHPERESTFASRDLSRVKDLFRG